jgi:multisubunit Na+/H+ antiporter MnhC subunit
MSSVDDGRIVRRIFAGLLVVVTVLGLAILSLGRASFAVLDAAGEEAPPFTACSVDYPTCTDPQPVLIVFGAAMVVAALVALVVMFVSRRRRHRHKPGRRPRR